VPIPNAIKLTPAATPPHSKNLRFVMPLSFRPIAADARPTLTSEGGCD
jgi:hypothetical protein